MLLKDRELLALVLGLTECANDVTLRMEETNQGYVEVEVQTQLSYHVIKVDSNLSLRTSLLVNGEYYEIVEKPLGNIKATLKTVLERTASEIRYKRAISGHPATLESKPKVATLLKTVVNANRGTYLTVRKSGSFYIIEVNGLVFTCDTETSMFSYTARSGIPLSESTKNLREYLISV